MSYDGLVKVRQLLRRLRQAGVVVSTRKGTGHWKLGYKGRVCPVPVHGDKDLAPSFIKEICRQLGLDPKEVL
jgi:predicted RNA binding protein YcfA (HicA-like mRNA interferase family)